MVFKNVLLNLIFTCLMSIILPTYSMKQINGKDYLRACADGSLTEVKRYIQNGGNKNYVNESGENACQWAAIGGKLNILKYLVEQKCDECLLKTYTPFHIAAQYGHIDIVRWYVNDRKLDVNLSSDFGVTPLHVASSKKNSLNVLRFLLDVSDIAINRSNAKGLFPIHYAIEGGNLEALQLLLEKGANLHVKCTQMTLVHFAAYYNQLEIIKFLVNKKNMDLQARTADDRGYTSFHMAAAYGAIEVGKWLISKDANISATTNHNESAFVLACKYGKIPFAKMLLPYVDVNAYFETCCKQTMLYVAAKNGNFEVVKFLLDNGADDTLESVCKTDGSRTTVLDIAEYNHRYEIVDYLKQIRLAESATRELLDKEDGENKKATKEGNRPKIGSKKAKKKKQRKNNAAAIPAGKESLPKVVDVPIANSDQVLSINDMNRSFTDFAHFRNDKLGFKQTFIFLYKGMSGLFTHDPQNKNMLVPFSQPIDNIGSLVAENFLADADYSIHVQRKEKDQKDHFHNPTRKIEQVYGGWANVIVTDYRDNPSQRELLKEEFGVENVQNLWFKLFCRIPARIQVGDKYPMEKARQLGPTGNFEYVVLAEKLSKEGNKMIVHRFFNKSVQ